MSVTSRPSVFGCNVHVIACGNSIIFDFMHCKPERSKFTNLPMSYMLFKDASLYGLYV